MPARRRRRHRRPPGTSRRGVAASCGHTAGPGGRTFKQLYSEAHDKGIEGRSKMNKQELERAVGR